MDRVTITNGDDTVTVPASTASVLIRNNRGWRPVDSSDLAPPVDDLNIREVLDHVGNDPALAAAALDVEKAGKNRSTLIDKLTAIANP